MALQHLRSSTAHKRPIPTVMSAGQIAINTNEASPGLFFKDSNGDLVKVGPVHIGTTAPNSSPASVAATALVTGTVYQILTVGTSDFTLVGASANTVGTIFTATGTTTGTGTVSGQQGVEKGEQWLDTTGGAYDLKIYDGTDWRSQAGEFVNATGDTMTGDLVMNNANIVFEGATADDFETTLTVTDPTADRSIVLPDVSGDIVTTGDTGTVTSTMIADGTIVNADVNASAAIAGTKIDPDFGSQTIETTGVFSAADGAAATPSITFTGDTNTGIYRPGADQVAISTNGTGRLFVDSSGNVGIGATSQVSSDVKLEVKDGIFAVTNSTSGDSRIFLGSSTSPGHAKGQIRYSLTDESLEFYSNSTERMRIDSSGRVGIGISSPTEKLTVAGGNIRIEGSSAQEIITFSNTSTGGRQWTIANAGVGNVHSVPVGTFYVRDSSGSANRMAIDSSGRVGIGTTSPSTRLSVAASSANGIELSQDLALSTDSSRLFFSTSAGSNALQSSSGSLRFFTGSTAGSSTGTERLRIDSSGRVGINNTSLTARLDIVGSPSSGTTASSDTQIALRNTNPNRAAYINFTQAAELAFYNTGGGTSNATTFINGGSERMRIDSSGRLLVGTSSNRTNYNLQLEGTTGAAAGASFIRNETGNSGGTITLGKSGGTSNGSFALVANNDTLGSIIFSGADGSASKNAAYIQAFVDGTPGANDMPGRLVFSTTADGASSPTGRMRINSGGTLTAFAGTIHQFKTARTSGSDEFMRFMNGATTMDNGTTRCRIRADGDLENTNNSYTGISDQKLKENIVEANSQWSDIKALQVRNYNFKQETNYGTHRQIGLIAQEVEIVSPGLVKEINDVDAEGNDLGTTTKSVNYSVLYMKAVKALQEAMDRIETLEAKVAALEAN